MNARTAPLGDILTPSGNRQKAQNRRPVRYRSAIGFGWSHHTHMCLEPFQWLGRFSIVIAKPWLLITGFLSMVLAIPFSHRRVAP